MESEADLVVSTGQYADIVRRRSRVVLVGLILSAVAASLAFAATGGGPGVSAAEATVEVKPVTANRFGSNTRLLDLVSMPTQVEILASTEVAQRVINRLGLDAEPDDLLTSLEVENPVNTLVLHLRFEAGRQDVALARVQAFAEEYLAFRTGDEEATIAATIAQVDLQRERIAQSLDSLREERLTVADDSIRAVTLDNDIAATSFRLQQFEGQIADLQGIFVDPGNVVSNARSVVATGAPGWITGIGVLGLGVMLSLGAAVAFDRLDVRARDESEIAHAVPAPVFGVQSVARAVDDDSESLGVRGAKARQTLGEYRRLRLLLEHPRHRVGKLLVATPIDDDAAGEVATNLARVLIRARERAVLVWCEDVRLAPLEEMGVVVEHHLDDVLQGRRTLAETLQPVAGQPGLSVVGLSVGRTSVISPERLRAVYDELLTDVDMVITVAPSASPADTAELASVVDGAVLAVDAQRAARSALRQGMSTLEAVTCPVIASFVTRRRPWW